MYLFAVYQTFINMSVENIQKFFDKVDDDKSGTITLDEFKELFRKFDVDGKL